MGTDPTDTSYSDFNEMPCVFNPKKGQYEYAFFKDRDPRFLNKLAVLLHRATFEKGETIIEEGEIGYNMYFLYSGKVGVRIGADQVQVATMQRGSYFGEMALYGMRRRTASICALERTDCLVVKRRIFEFLLKSFPEERKYFDGIGKARKEALLKGRGKGRKPVHPEVDAGGNGGGGASSDEEYTDRPGGDLPPILPDKSHERGHLVLQNHSLLDSKGAWERKSRRDAKKKEFRFSTTFTSKFPSIQGAKPEQGKAKPVSVRAPRVPSKGSPRRPVGVLGLAPLLKMK